MCSLDEKSQSSVPHWEAMIAGRVTTRPLLFRPSPDFKVISRASRAVCREDDVGCVNRVAEIEGVLAWRKRAVRNKAEHAVALHDRLRAYGNTLAQRAPQVYGDHLVVLNAEKRGIEAWVRIYRGCRNIELICLQAPN